jgi:hypothetical protein
VTAPPPHPPTEAEALAAARAAFPGCVTVGEAIRLWRQRPSAERPGLLEVVRPALGWAFVAWGARAAPLGIVELHAGGGGRALAVEGRPWLMHAIHLALAQLALPDLHAAYLVALEARPGTGMDRAFVADFLHHELVVPLAEGAGVTPGEEFAAWVCGAME